MHQKSFFINLQISFFIVMKVNFMHALLMLPSDCILSITMTFIDATSRHEVKSQIFEFSPFNFFFIHHHVMGNWWILINQTWKNRAVGFVEVITYNYYAQLHIILMYCLHAYSIINRDIFIEKSWPIYSEHIQTSVLSSPRLLLLR